MKHKPEYPSKIMLVGEYGVVVDGEALTIPFNRFSARVRKATDIPYGKEEEADLSRKYLADLFGFISSIPGNSFHASPDLELFSRYLDDYWLETTIPTGYGLGSSGAVSAAIYDLFFPDAGRLELHEQKQDLASIESYFHGKSSGMDALTCHAGKPLYFLRNGKIRPVEFNPATIPGGYRFFLLDSGERFDTGPLVEYFLQQLNDPGFANSIRNEYLVLNQKLIEALLGTRKADPALLVRAISDFQFNHFRRMIPETALDLWIDGVVSNVYYLKLNGSGGGYMLGITHESFMGSLQEKWKGKIIWIG
jgi:mevalonate kinase